MPGLYDQNEYVIDPTQVIPDMYPHGGVLREIPTLQDLQQGISPDGSDPIAGSLTAPGQRPEVQFRATMLAFSVTTTPQPITANRLSVDALVIDVPSTAANSVFFGYGGGISTASGLEVRAGIPLVWQPDNFREDWELQRQLEVIALMIGASLGIPQLPQYKAPRVVIDPSQYFLVASATTSISIALVYIPEQQ